MSDAECSERVEKSMRRRSRLAAIPVGAALVAGLVVPMTATTVSAASTASVAAGSVAATGPATITTFAGGGVGDGGPATKAILMGGQSNVSGLGVDPSGNVLVTSGTGTYFRNPSGLGSDRVRRIDAATGVVSTVLGSASQRFSGDGGPAAQAQVSNPSDVGFDGAGNMYVLDSGNQRVRKVAAGSGVVTTVVGGGNGNNIGDFSGDGGPATKADLRLFRPEPDSFAPGQFQYVARSGLAVDQAGDLFISDANNGRIRRVDGRTGIITTVAGSGIPPNVYIPPDGLGDGGPATLAAFPTLGCGCDPQSQPGDVAVDGAGNLFIGASITWGDDRVRRIDARTGIITTYAGGGSPADALGDGGPATSAAMNPTCVDVDRGGNLVLCDRGRLRRVDRTTGIITTIAGGGSPADGLGDGGPALPAPSRDHRTLLWMPVAPCTSPIPMAAESARSTRVRGSSQRWPAARAISATEARPHRRGWGRWRSPPSGPTPSSATAAQVPVSAGSVWSTRRG
ncbi:MAG: hypothetical protein M3083_13830 [Actinomycetota bacterium]|nr:hypothetical protein [Actinomycetota bacterium]